jgi:hypothetical protein
MNKKLNKPGRLLSKKGRSRQLINRRDEFLMVRYFYHTEVKRLRFDDVLKIMSEYEFFIEEQTIMNRLQYLSGEFKKLFAGKPSIAGLREMSGSFIIEVSQKEKESYEKNL